MTQRRRTWIQMILAILWGLCLATPLAKGLATGPDLEIGRVLPAMTEISGQAYQLNGKTSGAFTQSFQLDDASGLITIAIVSDIFEFQGSFTPALRVVKSEFVFKDQDLITYLGHDQRVTVWEKPARIKVKYYRNGRLKSEKSFPDQGVVDSDIILFYLQAMLQKNAGDFQCELFGKKDGLIVSAGFRLLPTADFIKLAPEYNYPEGLRHISGLKNDVFVYVMELKGLPRLFYSNKYYYVFEKSEPYRLIAYWGGPLKEAEYGYRKD